MNLQGTQNKLTRFLNKRVSDRVNKKIMLENINTLSAKPHERDDHTLCISKSAIVRLRD